MLGGLNLLHTLHYLNESAVTLGSTCILLSPWDTEGREMDFVHREFILGWSPGGWLIFPLYIAWDVLGGSNLLRTCHYLSWSLWWRSGLRASCCLSDTEHLGREINFAHTECIYWIGHQVVDWYFYDTLPVLCTGKFRLRRCVGRLKLAANFPLSLRTSLLCS